MITFSLLYKFYQGHVSYHRACLLLKFACWSMAQTGARVMDHVLHDRAAGPFLVGVGSGGTGRSVLLRPYGPLFALHQDGEHVLTCSPSGPIVYKVCFVKMMECHMLMSQY